MPLEFVQTGESAVIVKIAGKPEVKKHLENLGFTQGTEITMVSKNNGNVIVNVRDTRVALSRELAGRIRMDERTVRKGDCR